MKIVTNGKTYRLQYDDGSFYEEFTPAFLPLVGCVGSMSIWETEDLDEARIKWDTNTWVEVKQ